VLLLLRYWIAL